MKLTKKFIIILSIIFVYKGNSTIFATVTDNENPSFTIQANKLPNPGSPPKGQVEFDQSGLSFGITTELNGTFIVHQQTYGKSRLMPYSPSIKFAARAMIGYNFDPSEGIVVGIGYCGGGQNYHDVFDGITYTKSVTMSYTQVPVMFKYIFNTESSQSYAMAGLQFGFLSNSSITINDSSILPNQIKQSSTNSNSFFQSNDLGFRFEVGEDFLIADNLFFNAGIEAYVGLPDINIPDLRKEFTFRGNTYPYKKSSNFITGIEVGLHYMIK